MTVQTHYYVVDAFTCRPFAGNPAAVFRLKNGEMTNGCKMWRWR